jgi:hypothetical protein
MSLERKPPNPDFDRSRKNKKKVDSICLHCCATVAKASTEAELHAKEARHLCRQKRDKFMRRRSAKEEDAA